MCYYVLQKRPTSGNPGRNGKEVELQIKEYSFPCFPIIRQCLQSEYDNCVDGDDNDKISEYKLAFSFR